MNIHDLMKGIIAANPSAPQGGPTQTLTHLTNRSLAKKHGADAVKAKAMEANQRRTFSKGPTKGPIKPR